MIKINTISIFVVMALVTAVFGFSANAQTSPSVTTGTYSLIGARNVEMEGFVNANGSNANLKIQLSTDSTFNNNILPTASDPGWVSGQTSGTTRFVVRKINLLPGVTYYYRAVALNTNGETKSFMISNGTTSSGNSGSTGTTGSTGTVNNGNTSSNSGNSVSGPTAPSAATNGPVSVSANSAVLNGSIKPNNADAKFWFEFGLTQSFGKKTSIEQAGSGNLWQLVTGNLSGLESGRIYYYRVVAQNSFGTVMGDTMNFTTKNSNGSAVSSNTQSGGQVLGASTVSGNGNGNGNGTSKPSGSVATTVVRPPAQSNPRPSFISLEYSLADNGALVLVANDIKPKPGEEFTYTVVYKNDSQYPFNETGLKVIIPSEADYVGADTEPTLVSGGVIEFELGTVAPGQRGTVSVTVKIKETIKIGTSIIFTSVIGYKDRTGTQLATTSYMTVRAGEDGSSGSPSPLLGSLGSISGTFWLVGLGILVLMGLLAFRLIRIRNGKKDKNNIGSKNKKTEEEDIFGMGKIPATFEPIGQASPFGR